MEILSFVTLDVFTLTPYEGNPLAIINIPASSQHHLTSSRKQAIAAEFNLSESVFIHEQVDPTKREWTIDIYTTNEELPFAGHPTIGAACYVLGLQRRAGNDGKGIFITKAGRIPISLVENNSLTRVQADIPHNVHIHKHIIGDLGAHIQGLSSHPGLRKAEMGASIVSIVKGMTFMLVRLENLEMLALVQNTNSELRFHGLLDAGWEEGFVARYYYVVEDGLELNGRAEDGIMRIRTRMLEAAMEDPATGSAACALGSFLALILKSHGTQKFEIVQGVEMGRRSVIGVEVAIDQFGQKVESVRLNGSAVQVMEGNLRIQH